MKIVHTFLIAEVIGVFPHKWYSNIYEGGEKDMTSNNLNKFNFLE